MHSAYVDYAISRFKPPERDRSRREEANKSGHVNLVDGTGQIGNAGISPSSAFFLERTFFIGSRLVRICLLRTNLQLNHK